MGVGVSCFSSRRTSSEYLRISFRYNGKTRRSLGLSAHLAWARLLIDRTNEQIKYPDAQSNNRKPKDSGDDEAIAHENYFNPESGFAASERTTGQSP